MFINRPGIRILKAAVAAACLLAVSLATAAGIEQAPPGARRVLELIDRIERETAAGPAAAARRESVSEEDLNAYIAYRIESEKEEILKELRLKLFPKSRIEGRVLIDLSGRDIPAGVKPRMTLLFAGTLRSRQGMVRLELESFYLGEQKIDPAFLDFVIGLVARLEGQEPFKIEDWQPLPFGIREMAADRGRLGVEY